MLVELGGWTASQSGMMLSSVTFARAAQVVLLLLATILALYYRTLLLQWRSTVYSVTVSTWSLTRQPVPAADPAAVQNLVTVDKRLSLDSAESRRLSRAEFLQEHKDFDYGMSIVKDKELGLKVTEKYVTNLRGMEMFVKSWMPEEGRPKGILFLCHGYGDTVTFFFEGLARIWAAAGYAVFGMDYPGFGLSEGLHGYVPNFDNLVDDVVEQYRAVKGYPEMEGLPCFLFGESMGGAVALKAHLKYPDMWDGAILVAPMCKIADSMYPPWYLVQIMIALAHIIPKAKLVTNRDIAEIGFRDLVKRKRAEMNPVAYVGNPRLGTALSLLRTTDEIERRMGEVALPMLIIHGGSDVVTDPSISKILHEKAKSTDKVLRLYEEAWHCLLEGEPDYMVKKVMADIITWLDARSTSRSFMEDGKDSRKSDGEQALVLAEMTPELVACGKSVGNQYD
ncbi:unnamed protein product [Sphagnum troendelagicum]